MHSNWRDCKAWKDENLSMNTTSNEACKLYDVCLSQLAGFYENHLYGGLASSLNQLTDSDPNFVLGHCLKYGAELLGTNSLLNSNEQRQNVNNLINLTKNTANLTKREKLHVNAIEKLQYGDLEKSIDLWEEILVEHPTDMLAIKFCHSGYFYTGKGIQMRDSLARVLPQWKPDLPLFGYLYGLYAFGLTQTNELDKAEKYAKKGLELNRFDGWACHSIAHVNEYRSSYNEGIEFMLKTENDWLTSDLISAHNYWHLCLFYLENQEYDKILDILENNNSFKNPKFTIDLVNCSSLLMRLKLDDFKQKDYLIDRFNDLKQRFSDRIDQHGYAYSDSHMAVIYSICGTEEEKSLYLRSLNQFIESNGEFLSDYIKNLNRNISHDLFKALFYYGQNEFDKCVELLYPLRYDLFNIGGSNAQRDLFNLILIDSCFRSNLKYHQQIGHGLYIERLAYRPNSNLTKRISQRFFLNELYTNL